MIPQLLPVGRAVARTADATVIGACAYAALDAPTMLQGGTNKVVRRSVRGADGAEGAQRRTTARRHVIITSDVIRAEDSPE